MYNWSTDTTKFTDKEKEDIWGLEQLINYGLNGRKLSRHALLTHLPKLSLDPHRRKFIELLLNANSHSKTNPSA